MSRSLKPFHRFLLTRRAIPSKKIASATIALLFAFEVPLFAYSDPGSGALAWQLFVAAFVGVGFYVRRLPAWFTRVMRRGVKRQ
jgi:hypothetical protein